MDGRQGVTGEASEWRVGPYSSELRLLFSIQQIESKQTRQTHVIAPGLLNGHLVLSLLLLYAKDSTLYDPGERFRPVLTGLIVFMW